MRRVCGKAIEAAFSRQLHCDLVCERARRGKAKRVSLLCESLHRFTFATFGATTNTLTQCKFPSVSERANERTWEKTALSLSLLKRAFIRVCSLIRSLTCSRFSLRFSIRIFIRPSLLLSNSTQLSLTVHQVSPPCTQNARTLPCLRE